MASAVPTKPGGAPAPQGRRRALADADLPRIGRVETVVLLLTLLAAALRLFKLGGNSLWVDEYATLKLVSLPFSEILGAVARVNFCPPLYFWLVHGVVSVLGPSEAGLRLVSAVAGALTVPVAYLLTRELTGRHAIGLTSAALLAVNPLHLWYSQEARPYALLVFLGSVALLFLVLGARRSTPTSWGGFSVAMAGALLTHTIAPILLAVAWAWTLIFRHRAVLIRPLLISSAAAALVAAPFFVMIVGVVSRAGGTHSPARPLTGLEIPYTLLTYVFGYSFGPSTREIQNVGALEAVQLHPVQSLIAALVIVPLVCLALLRPAPARRYFVILWLFPLVAMFLASAASGKAYQARYALVGLIGLCGLAAGMLWRVPRRARAALAAGLLFLSLWADTQWFVMPVYWKDDSRGAVAWLAERLPRGSVVLTAPGYTAGVLAHYAAVERASLRFMAADTAGAASAPAALLLTRLHHVGDPEGVEARFRQAAGSGVRVDSVGGYLVLSRSDAALERGRP